MWRFNPMQSIALKVTQGIAKLHSEGICHSDLTAENVLFRLDNFDSWSEHKLYKQLGSPRMLNIHRSPGRPRYLVDWHISSKLDQEYYHRRPQRIFLHQISSSSRTSPLTITLVHEVLCGRDATIYSDIWAIACLICEMRSGSPLFSLAKLFGIHHLKRSTKLSRCLESFLPT